ncbi:hypothetical protein CDQ84_02830 [Clostridium thermosuccinogenes]|jgi:LacI family transcriptional regulator|uniref:HTH lacI-type domain-containing protein n=1 Tax=Clostridium thermosuccinogenes TaxID=84032 RepID=A0A2K2FQM5_9CLOT|nr:LacI family DNA-binding transcriptional regulator [Pseudoclostridium thermosuccinogenes]AUS96003.1 hypothetical protein CDO33_05855 [Pseudoclostridium thermosuccinogenes]PNT93273.1 hypothetical protein CDQ83_07075 [Pseudoclostridium thermosuccinogenes]PNT99392.1 hypothetical protein CDQ85_02830 [Pseudoclostridium thermosuccinogenes]PNU01079.1 hypothetical protein CDQ84_02830 [Pseudoclostridium thermosuccinogenes]
MDFSYPKVTITDIANKANVSITTVSRVLNGNPAVSKKTRKKVEKIIEEMGYIPNALARGLVNNSSNTIGLIVSDITNSFFADVIQGIESVLSSYGISVFLCNTGYSREKEDSYILQMLSKRVDGLIIFSTYANHEDTIRKAKEIVPIVTVQSSFDGVDCINTTDEKGAYDAVSYMIKCGHKHIAFLTYGYDNTTILDRKKGYIRALEDNGIPVDEKLIISSEFKPNCGYHMTQELLDKAPYVTAIFAYNDQIALGVYLCLQKRGLRIPEDISVVGYDDTELATLVNPSLTTVGQPRKEMGTSAAELLVKRIRERKSFIPQTVLLPTTLIERESVRKL